MFSLRESFPYEFPQIIDIPVTKAEVICALKIKTACGYDGLSNKILKLCSSQISKPITYIFNKPLTCCICPNCHFLRNVTNHKYQIIDLDLY